MNIIKTIAMTLFVLTVAFVGYLLRYSFESYYFLLGVFLFFLALFLLNMYMNGGNNKY